MDFDRLVAESIKVSIARLGRSGDSDHDLPKRDRTPKRHWPRRLVGDSPGLRARFRWEHPDIRISLERGSGYRAWLNGQRRQVSKQLDRRAGKLQGYASGGSSFASGVHRTRRPHRTLVLQEAFSTAIRSGTVPGRSNGGSSVQYDYYGWLRSKGIDPETGRMTIEGFAFFKALLDADRSRKEGHRRAA